MATNLDFSQEFEESFPSPSWEQFDAFSIPKSHLDLIFDQKISSETDSNFQETISQWKKNAGIGSPEAQYCLGKCYEEGIGVMHSFKEAFRYYKLAADQGLASAQVHLGLLFAAGLGEKQSDVLAFHYYTLAADQGSQAALILIGKCYEEGKGVEKSLDRAIEYYEAAAHQECPTAYLLLATLYSTQNEKKSTDKANDYYRKYMATKSVQIQGKDPYTLAVIGFNFEHGHGVKKSMEAALFYYRQSALGHCALGQCLLAKCYEAGNGVPKSEEQALHYYKLAADQGHAASMWSLSHSLLTKGMNPELAVDYLKRVLQQGKKIKPLLLATCQYDLGTCFEKGTGVNQSNQNAIHYYQLAAQNGSCEAQKKLGDAYSEGKLGLKKSPQKASEYHRAAQLQNPIYGKKLIQKGETKKIGKTLSNASQFFPKDHTIERTDSAADSFNSYKLLADQGDTQAQWGVAQRYQDGIGTQQSSEEAMKYYQLAAENGHIESCKYLFDKYHFGKTGEQSYENALHYLKILANKEIPIYQYNLGVYYKNGFAGLDPSDENAFKYYKLAADQGCAQAQWAVAQKYQEGIGTIQSSEEAIKYYQLAAENGDVDACKYLFYEYHSGKSVEQSYEKALHYLEILANKKISNFQYNLGFYYKNGFGGLDPSDENAFIHYKLAADQGHAQAQWVVAQKYQDGVGTKQSSEEAMKYYQLAAENGHIESCKFLYNNYNFGKTGEQSYEKALHYLEILANKGIALYQYNLGVYYKFGYGGLKQSDEHSFKWYKLAADQGVPDAQCLVAQRYRDGIGTEQSTKESMKYYQLATDNGDIDSCKFLFRNYNLGGTGEQSYEKALPYLKILVNKKIPIFQFAMGDYYKNGYAGLDKSDENAFKYYKLAADQGHAQAQWVVAKGYHHGIGTEQSSEEAMKYYHLAADHGHRGSQYFLAKCYQNGRKEIKENWEKALFYHKLAAYQGHIKSIRLLYKWYYYGIKVEESQEEALKYLNLGAQFNDPECQYCLADYYERGLGNLTRSIAKTWKYCRLAADQGHESAQLAVRKMNRLLHPHAQEVDIQPYLKDQHLSTLENILKNYGNTPIFLEMDHFSWEEAQVISHAMIENPRFTFMCYENEISSLFLAFELCGFDKKKALNYSDVVNPSTQQEIFGCVFVGHDISDSLLKFEEDDPQVLKKKRLEEIAQQKRIENINRAHQIFLTLPQMEIIYPGAQQLDLSFYLENRKIDVLKKLLESTQDKPTYFIYPNATHEEINSIRDAMIANPRLTYIGFKSDYFTMWEAFHQAGYSFKNFIKKKLIKEDGEFYGIVFRGK